MWFAKDTFLGAFVQVKATISAIRYTEHFPRLPLEFQISGQRSADMFDLLEYVFGFQVCICIYFDFFFPLNILSMVMI